MVSWQRDPEALIGSWTVYRQVGRGYPPLWHVGSQRRPTRQPSARWHDSDLGQFAQYFSFETDGAWAELVRWEHIRTEDERLSYQHKLWQCWIEESGIANLATFDLIEACGLDPRMFVDDDHASCRTLANELMAHGYRGLITPSAALGDVQNLTVFGSRRELVGRQHVGRNPRPDAYVVVSLAAEGPPPAHVVDTARLYGDPHLRLEAWLANED